MNNMYLLVCCIVFFVKQKTAYEMRISDWSSDVCSSDLRCDPEIGLHLCPHLPVFHGEVLEYLIFSSATLGEGMERALKYLRLLSDALNVRIITDPRGARALIKGTAAEAPQLRHTEICIVFELMQFLKSVTEGRFVPQRITLQIGRASCRKRVCKHV